MEGNNSRLWNDYCEASRKVCALVQKINDTENDVAELRRKFSKWTKLLDERSAAYDAANQRGALPRPYDDPSKDWQPQSTARTLVFPTSGDDYPDQLMEVTTVSDSSQ